MPGIYIHIPFCKKKCFYCDFYTSQNLKNKNEFLQALHKEIKLRSVFFKPDEKIKTIYFGGGTPSVLSPDEIQSISDSLYENFNISDDIEFTIEANPDDLNSDYIKKLSKTKVNRLSVGIQSFNDDYLKLMNRRHNAEQAETSIKISQDAGFSNISVDLIYGLPNSNLQFLEKELNKYISLDIQHISAYHLTYEQGTVFSHYLKTGKLHELPDDESYKQYLYLCDFLKSNNFEHYEISNFAKNNNISIHNSNYWKNVKYLGLGPSAHSYNKEQRFWNLSDINLYITNIMKGKTPIEYENLTIDDKFNDYLLTGLRTKWGVSLVVIKQHFGQKYYEHITNVTKKYIENAYLKTIENNLFLPEEKWFLSDKIISDLIYV